MVELLKALGEAASTDVPDKVAQNRRAIAIVAFPVSRTRKRRLRRKRRYRDDRPFVLSKQSKTERRCAAPVRPGAPGATFRGVECF